MRWCRSIWFLALLALLPRVAFCDTLPTRDVTLPPVEVASAYNTDCPVKVQPPYAHPQGTIFVGAFTTLTTRFGSRIGAGTIICPGYQGLVRFDLSDVSADSIVSATLFYEAKENYHLDGSVSDNRATCVIGIGATTQTWSAEQKVITPPLSEVDNFRAPRGNFQSPPVDITDFLKSNLAEVRANGIAFDATVENLAIHYCYAALGRIELRLKLAKAAR